jgi:hypothetical protein
MHWNGLRAAELTAAIISVLGMVSVVLLPETRGRSLEEITGN